MNCCLFFFFEKLCRADTRNVKSYSYIYSKGRLLYSQLSFFTNIKAQITSRKNRIAIDRRVLKKYVFKKICFYFCMKTWQLSLGLAR